MSSNNYFIQQGSRFNLQNGMSSVTHPKLPAGNYVVKLNMFGYFLEKIEDFGPQGTIYGNVLTTANRIINTFESRDKSTGVLLSGIKGTGKTMMSRILGIECFNRGIPCLIINEPHIGDAFNQFIQDINQPALIMFDEFEKVYPKEKQEHMLTLLDGVFPTKKLFVLTSNSMLRMDDNLIQRPGRIFYHIEYKGLDEQFIRDYCNANLNDKSHIEKICTLASMYYAFTFDILKAIVEEMNRYNETPAEAVRLLNAKPEAYSRNLQFSVEMKIDDRVINIERFNPDNFTGTPGVAPFTVEYYGEFKDDPDDEDNEIVIHEEFSFIMMPEDMTSIIPKEGKFQFEKVLENGKKVSLTMRRKKEGDNYSYLDRLF